MFRVYGYLPTGKCVLSDIDEVLVDVSERLRKSLEEVKASSIDELKGEKRKRLWEVFLSEKYIHLDKPNPIAINWIKKRDSERYGIAILTGRPFKLLKATLNQLKTFNIPFDAIIFRANNYQAKDSKYKITVVKVLNLDIIEAHDDSYEVCNAYINRIENVYIWINLKPLKYLPLLNTTTH